MRNRNLLLLLSPEQHAPASTFLNETVYRELLWFQSSVASEGRVSAGSPSGSGRINRQPLAMCGIAVSLSPANLPAAIQEEVWRRLTDGVRSRGNFHARHCTISSNSVEFTGPDAEAEVLHRLASAVDGSLWNLRLFGAVLALRGPLTRQPLASANNQSHLLWNGEVFAGLEVWSMIMARRELIPAQVAHDENDGQILLDAVTSRGLNVLEAIEGPFAFVHFSVCGTNRSQPSANTFITGEIRCVEVWPRSPRS